jgi:hypothetical protein
VIDPYDSTWSWNSLGRDDRWHLITAAHADVADLIDIAIRDEHGTATAADLARKEQICDWLTRIPTVYLVSWLTRIVANTTVVLADHSEITTDAVSERIRESAAHVLDRGEAVMRRLGSQP